MAQGSNRRRQLLLEARKSARSIGSEKLCATVSTRAFSLRPDRRWGSSLTRLLRVRAPSWCSLRAPTGRGLQSPQLGCERRCEGRARLGCRSRDGCELARTDRHGHADPGGDLAPTYLRPPTLQVKPGQLHVRRPGITLRRPVQCSNSLQPSVEPDRQLGEIRPISRSVRRPMTPRSITRLGHGVTLCVHHRGSTDYGIS